MRSGTMKKAGIYLLVGGGIVYVGEKFIPQLKGFDKFAMLAIGAGAIIFVVGMIL